jgi:hypothetical protein
LLAVLAVASVPAVALRAACVGKSCPAPPPAASPPPFCVLPQEDRALIAAGFREGRSPDVPVFGPITTEIDGREVDWSMAPAVTRVPLAFVGPGLLTHRLPAGVTLDHVAPTLALAAHVRRPHPEARSGEAIGDLVRPGERAPLLVVIAWKGIGSSTLRGDRGDWPELRALMHEGASTLEASTGSVPVDPAAVLSTIGAGAVPSDHGVTGSLIRTDSGVVVSAWSERAPLPVIAFLGDDLDASSAERARIGLVAAEQTDRGLIGGRWYLGHDRDEVRITTVPLRAVQQLLDGGFGSDGVADLLAVSLRGRLRVLDRITGEIVRAVRSRAPDTLFAITATGAGPDPTTAATPSQLSTDVDRELGAPGAVRAIGPSGVFLDRGIAVSAETTSRAVQRIGGRIGVGLVAFPGYAVTLQRFC